jgi:hypothetical protein
MVTMVDEIFDRDYQAARASLNGSLSGAFSHLAQSIGESFKVLHRIEWSAPWTNTSKTARRA